MLGGAPRALAAPVPAAGAGTPEQVHLTWGDDPATGVVVSWASPGQAANPRVQVDGHAGVRAVFTRAGADAVEDATWSAKRDPATGYGVAVFDVDPGTQDGQTSITVTYYHAVGADPVNPATGAKGAPTPTYTEYERFTLVRPRSDGQIARPSQAGKAAVSG